ncbi:flagellar hook-associated protein FlgK [Thalassospira sp. GO-4]|jgi:flagellar hook-associated protein 1 FlgK|uniref:flagellar hook-associated protein FlgK n=1 Tax=Thalassospira sp. GO-4 TaxID=2946605 RepID=UPI002024F6E3|nr:flagellar hook-associated protein FlgK [Thalassospira sp. GO-4]URK16379.1 flagellar hook-associated protein FlgK [Thalassospira sp. GO-4]
MSIRAAQSAALSALQTSQAGISVSSENIANASVEGYTAKSLSLSSSVTTGASTGVTVTSVGSTVDSYLLKSISEAASESGYASVFSDPLNMVASQFGDVGDDGAISTLIADLETAIAALAVSADSQSEKSTTLSEANAIADELNNLSQSVQDQRASADQSIEDTVDQINDLLNEIHAYNNQLSGTDGTTLTTSELEDARAQAINELSELVDISYYTDSSNTTQIYIGGTLVVGSQVQELSYNAVGTVTSDTTFADITVNGNSITDSISGGSLGGLIELRDETLPDIQEELDNLATTLMDSINAVTNLGTAYPAPSELVGSEEVDLTDAFSGTGTVRLAATDEDGNAVEVIEIDLSTITTVQDLVDAINSSTYLDASVGSDGTLEIAASDDDYGVSIINMDASVGAEDQGFSDYFGLNDMFTGTDAGNISVNSAWLDDTSRLPVGSGSDDATLAVGESVISSGSSDVAEALADLFDENVSFDAAGNLGSTKTTLSDYAAEILSDVAQQASSAETEASVATSAYEELVESFSNQYGVNTDEEALTLSNLQSAYEAAAAILEITQSLMDTLLEAVS